MRGLCLIAFFLSLLNAADAGETLPLPREVRFDQFGDRMPDGVIARLGTTRLRHPAADTLVLHPSGESFFTNGRDDCVRVWDAKTGALLNRWELPPERSGALCFSADGKIAVIQSSTQLEIRNLATGRLEKQLPLGDAPSVSSACLSSDGCWLASADYTPREHRLRLWDLRTGENRVVGAHENYVTQVILSPDLSRLFSYSRNDRMLIAWDLNNNKEVWSRCDLEMPVSLSSNGQRLFAQTRLDRGTSSANVLNPASGKPIFKALPIDLAHHENTLSRDGSLIAIYDNKKLAVYDAGEQKKLQEWDLHPHAVSFSQDGSTLYVIVWPGVIQAYSLRTGKPLFSTTTLSAHSGIVDQITWSPDGQMIASATKKLDPFVRIWNAMNGKLIHRLPTLHQPSAGMEFSRDGRSLWTCGNRSPLFKWDVETGKESKKWFVVHDDDYEKPYGQILAAKVLPDGKQVRLLVVGNEERERPFVVTFDLDSGKFGLEHAVNLPFHLLDQAHLLEHRLSCAGQVLIPVTGQELPSLEDPDDDQWIDTRLSTNTWLVAAARWKRIDQKHAPTIDDAAIFERATGRILFELPRGPAGKYAFAPDGRHFAVAAPDGIHIWNLATRVKVQFIKGHDPFSVFSSGSFATAIAFSPDGKRVATGHADTTILIWDVALLTQEKVEPLSPEDLEDTWADLMHPDRKRAIAAVWALQDRPEQAIKLLQQRLKPVREPDDIKKLIDQLDDDNFRLREAARKRIGEHGDAAWPALNAAMKGKVSAEQQKLIERLLEPLSRSKAPYGNDLRGIRCLMVLEKLKTAEARKLVEEVSKGMPSARLTGEAIDCLDRMN